MKLLLSELNLLLITLLSAAAVLIFLLVLKIRALQKEREQLRHEDKEDARVLFLNSRYASMGETLGNIAHQWKQPLNAIGTIQNSIKAALIFQGEISKDKLLHSVETSFKLLQHLAETIDTFYSFLAQQHNENRNFIISDELDTIRKITEYSFENSNIQLIFDLQANPTIQGNPNEFTHALLNLILNAKDAFDNAGSDAPLIAVCVLGGEKTCTITVTDNAGGIRLKPIEMVFDLHITTKEEGSGLGLYMTKKIIEERFGGSIAVDNKKEGACFTITLPYAQYGEYVADTLTPDERLSLARINQLTRKVIELEEVEKNLQKWADIFKKAHWAIAVHVGTSSTFELTNDTFNSLYGYTSEEFKTLSVPDLFTPESLPILFEIQKEAFEKGYAAFESIHKRRDGSIFPVSVELIVVKDDEGEILYHIANIWDQTEKKVAEERLLLKKFALDHIKDAVFMVNEHAIFQYVNEGACKALGYSYEEMLSMNVGDIDPDWPRERWDEHWEALKKVGSMTMELRHRRRDGTIFPVEVSANYIEFNGKHYNMSIARDITERLQLEAEKENRVFKMIAENIPDNIARWDTEGRYLYINPTHERTLGVPAADIIGKTTKEAFPDGTFAVGENSVDQVLATGKALFVQHPIVQEDGYMGWHDVNYVPERDESGKIISVLGVGRDMTSIYRLQNALAEREKELRALADSSPGMMGTFHMKPDGLVCMPYVSPNIVDLFGLTPEEVREDATPLIALNHPDDAARVGESIAASAQSMNVWHEEYRILHPIKGERWMESNMMPQPHPDGGIVWYGYVHDITKRKELESLLDKERKFLIDAQHVAHTGSWYLDIQKGVLSWSDETYKIFELEKEDVDDLHKTFYEIVHPDDREMVNAPYLETIKTGLPYEIEHRIVMADGRIKHVIERCEHFYDDNGTPLYSIGTVQDITERKRMEASLQDANDRYIQILDNSTDVIYLIEVTLEGRFVYVDVNAAYEEVTGIPRDVVIGLDVEDIEDETFRTILIDKFTTCLNAREKTDYTADYPFPSGIRTFHSILSPIRDDSGRIVRIVGSARDITEQKKIEDALQSNRNLLHAILESSPGVITFALDKNYRYIAFDSKHAYVMHSIFGKKISIGMDMFEVIGTDTDRKIAKQSFDRALGGESFTAEEEYGNKRLSRNHWQIFYSPIYSQRGEIIGLTCFNMDITERKEAENAIKELNETLEKRVIQRTAQLQETQETFRAIVENSPDVISRYDLQMRRTYINPMMQFLLGKPLNEVLGKTPREFSPLPDVDVFEHLFDTVVRGKNEIEYEGPFTAPWGERRWGNQRLVPEFDEDRNVISVMVIGRDMTERVEMEKRLKMIETAINSSAEAVYINDKELSIVYVNDEACRMLGYSRDELLRMKIFEIDAKYTIQEIGEIIKTKIEKGKVNFQTQHRKKDGMVIDVEIAGSFFTYEEDTIFISIVKNKTREFSAMQ